MSRAIFYYAGCPICVDAEKVVLDYFDKSKLLQKWCILGQSKIVLMKQKKLG